MKNPKALIENAIIWLIKYKPFYGHMVLNMNLHFRKEAMIAGINVTDAVNLYINPEMFQIMTLEQQVAILEHEVNHLVNTHMNRKGNREHQTFNVACDIAINQFIENLPPKEKIMDMFEKVFKTPRKELEKVISGIHTPEMHKFEKNLTSEEYYELLKEEQKKNGTDGNEEIEVEIQLGDGSGEGEGQEGDVQGKKITIRIPKNCLDDHSKWEEKGSLNDELVKEKIKGLVNKVINSVEAGSIPSHIRQSITELFRTSTRWKQMLNRFLTRATLISQKTSRKKLNRRFGHVFPGHNTEFKLKIAVAIDESGSINDELSKLFFSEFTRLNLVSPEIHMFQFDTECSKPVLYKKYKKLERQKDGGTMFQPALDVAKELGVDALVILTDGEASLDLVKPRIPVLWALQGSDYDKFKPPFGLKIKLEPDTEMKRRQ